MSNYWEKREAEALKHCLKDEEEYEKRLHEIYEDMLSGIQAEINEFYIKYARKEGITLAEAKKRVSQLDIRAYERKAKRYVKDKDFSKQANEEMRLYNATMKINRLEMLKANIGLNLIAGHDELEDFMAEILKGRTETELRRQAGILGKTIKNNAQMAEAIVNASFHNATFSDRIWMYQGLLRDELDRLLQVGLIQGRNPRALAKELRKRFDVSESNAERLMRTELARVQTEAQKQSYIRNGFSQYTFHVNTGCCDVCGALNGKHFPVQKMMPGENAPPMHPRCRCSTSAYEDSAEYKAWLDFLNKGGTTEEWKNFKKNLLEKAIVESYTLNDSTDKWAEEAREELLKYESAISKRKVEIATVYDDDGSVLFKKYGKDNEVSFTVFEMLRLKDKVVTHNHPTGGSFSVGDIDLIRRSKMSELRVSTENGVYYMRYPQKWDKQIDSREKIEAEREKIRKPLKRKYQQMYLDGKITKAERFQMLSDEANRKFAERFGIEYGKESYND